MQAEHTENPDNVHCRMAEIPGEVDSCIIAFCSNETPKPTTNSSMPGKRLVANSHQLKSC
jgi:hypothetical protein